jgi:hypothetical protein
MGQSGLFDAGWEGVLRHHGTAHRDRPGLCAAYFGDRRAIGGGPRDQERAERHWAGLAVSATARRHRRTSDLPSPTMPSRNLKSVVTLGD